MIKTRVLKHIAAVLALMLMVGGCAPSTRHVEDSSQPEIGAGTIHLTDSSAESAPHDNYQPECPPVEDLQALTRDEPQSSSSTAEQPKAASSTAEQPKAVSSTAEQPKAASSTAEQPKATSSTAEQPVASQSQPQSDTKMMVGESSTVRTSVSGEVRSVWISYLELNNLLTGKTRSQFTQNIRTVFDTCAAYGLNTVVAHVRPFADALYQSEYYPWSYICTGTEGQDPGFDPLEIMVEEAHARGLRIEAWVNPYRIRAADSKVALSSSNQAKKWLDAGDEAVITYNGVISYNPASAKSRELIVNGVREIVRRYDVDGIHIDDYFYPATASGAVDSGFDAASYKAYQNGGGNLSQADWRRSNVETLLKAMYAGIKAEDPGVLFGISPQSSVYNNYHAMFLDVAKILASPGYCDYICPQIYFGYQNDAQPYKSTLESWQKMITAPGVELYVGLAAYKSGAVDNWAGAGKNEWTQNTDLLKRMVESARQQSRYKGFVIYRYDSLFNPAQSVSAHLQKEASNLKSILN